MGWSRSINILYIWLLLFPLVAVAQSADPIVGSPEVGSSDAEILKPSTPNQQNEYLEEPVKVQPFDKKRWEDVTDGMSYTEDQEKTVQNEGNSSGSAEDGTKQDRPEKMEEPKPSRSFNIPGLGALAGLFQLLAIIVVILLVGMIIYILVRAFSGSSNTKVSSSSAIVNTLEELEENIHEADLERALRLALEQKNYKLAVRIYYLIIIRDMSSLKLIVWKRDKTNGEYVRELYSKPQYESFRDITLDFDKVWYGDEEVNHSQFEYLQGKFSHFIQSLKGRNKA